MLTWPQALQNEHKHRAVHVFNSFTEELGQLLNLASSESVAVEGNKEAKRDGTRRQRSEAAEKGELYENKR